MLGSDTTTITELGQDRLGVHPVLRTDTLQVTNLIQRPATELRVVVKLALHLVTPGVHALGHTRIDGTPGGATGEPTEVGNPRVRRILTVDHRLRLDTDSRTIIATACGHGKRGTRLQQSLVALLALLFVLDPLIESANLAQQFLDPSFLLLGELCAILALLVFQKRVKFCGERVTLLRDFPGVQGLTSYSWCSVTPRLPNHPQRYESPWPGQRSLTYGVWYYEAPAKRQ